MTMGVDIRSNRDEPTVTTLSPFGASGTLLGLV
jgi:hypothetical protein